VADRLTADDVDIVLYYIIVLYYKG